LGQSLVPFLLKNGRYTYVNSKTKNIIVKKQFDEALPFDNGVAFVKLRSKWGAIDSLGQFILLPEYGYIQRLQGGFIEGYFDYQQVVNFESGNSDDLYETPDTLIHYPSKSTPNWIFVTHFTNDSKSDDYAIVYRRNTDRFSIINNKLIYITDLKEELFERVTYTGGRSYYRIRKIENYHDGYFPIKLGATNSSGEQFVDFLNIKGEYLLKENYYDFDDESDIHAFNSGLALVLKDDKYGFIDTSRNEIVPLKYSSLGLFSDEVSNATFGDFKGYIDIKGNPLFPFVNQENYEYFGEFNEGYALIVEKVGKNLMYSIIDNKGKKINSFALNYGNFQGKFSNGKLPIQMRENQKYFYDVYDFKGNVAYKINFPEASNFSRDGYSLVKNGEDSEKYSIIESQKGREIFFNRYDAIYNSYDRRDTSEFEKIELDKEIDFTRINIFFSGLVQVESSGLKFYVDKDGFEYYE
jgi:hypothetical protein